MLRGGDDWAGEHFAFDQRGALADASSREQDSAAGENKSVVTIEHGPDGASATIADAHLLFNAHFARSGNDLVLNGDDNKSVVVQDYFAADERARLLSAEGAALSADVVAALAGPLAPGQYAQAGGAQPAQVQAVGRVAAVEGNATILRNGVVIAANVGDAVLKGDVLQTTSGQLGVTFADGSTLNLTANSRMVVNEFVYQTNGTQNSQLLNLVQGSLTFISGEVAHTGNMKIGTPVATMGIRGTVGGVTTANDGTVHFYVSQSATGAVIIDSSGAIIANVVQDGPLIVVRPVGPLQVIAEEVNKSPAQVATELAALQHIISVQSVGQQIIQQFFQQDPNNPNPQSTDGPHTQIQIDLIPNQNSGPNNNGTPGDNGVQVPDSGTVTITPPSTPDTPTTPDVPPIVINVPIPQNLAPINFGPANASVDEDGALTFSGQTAVTVFDSDSDVLTVTLTATHGVLTLSGIAGLTFISGDGAADAAMKFSGTQAAINAALTGATFNPDSDFVGEASVSVVTSDGNSTTAPQVIPITVAAVENVAPEAHSAHASVSEEGLMGGIADCSGCPDTTNSVTAHGTICATDADGDQLTFALGEPNTALCSGGVPICWELCDGDTKLVGKADGQTILTVTINSDTGVYCVTLSGPIDHPNHWEEDVKGVRIPVNVSDGQSETCTTLTVKIEDDSPRAANVSVSAVASAIHGFNVAFVLDYSGSIDSSELNTMLNAVKTAGQAIFNGTTDPVHITVVGFGNDAAPLGTFTTYAAFQDAIDQTLTNRPVDSGGTNFDAALQQVITSYSPISNANNEVFFLSDGQSTLSPGTSDDWQEFVADNHISVTAVGIGNGIVTSGLQAVDVDGSGAPVTVNEFSDLVDSLLSLVSTQSHNIFTDTMNTDGFGADGGYIKSVEVDGVEYSFDGNNSIISGSEGPVSQGTSISIATALGGLFTFYFAASQGHAAGDWTYTPPDSLTAPANEVFHYTLTDNDGDKAGADISVSVTAANYSPAVDLDSTQPGTGYVTSVAPDDTAVAAFGDHVSITDADSANLQSALVSFQGDYVYDDLFVDGTGLAGATIEYNGHAGTYDGLTWQYSGGGSGINLAVTGDASVATYTELLNAVRFSSHSSTLTDREVSVTVSDGTNDSAVATAIVQFETPQTNEAPVFDASGIAAIFGQSSVTVTGVTLSDADAGGDILSGSITAEHGTLTLAGQNINNVTGSGTANLAGQGTLAEINAALDDGIVYTPNLQSPPATDKVTLTADDGHGGTDSLTFLFAVAQSGVTLEGTSGKDVIVASPGNDTLTGHDGTDAFVFGPYSGAANSDVITDFSGHGGDGDFLTLSGFSVADFDELLGHLTDVEHGNGAHDTVITIEQTIITLQNVAASTLSEADFIFHPANIT